jgi:arginyl-tRNA synthetase
MGVGFDRIERESEIYQLGKTIVEDGLNDGVFYKLPDGAVAFDQTKIGLEGKKVVLRGDGTSLYITQDLGTAAMRHDKDAFDRAIYVVGNEQDHYFKVLFGVLGELRPALRGRLTHRSYGMVELPDGRMKSREGTVVDADDLMDELHEAVLAANVERWSHLAEAEQRRRAEAIAQAGLRYFLLKNSPARTIIFDKQASISFEGDTGPYCQYAYARCAAILGKVGQSLDGVEPDYAALAEGHARRLLLSLLALPDLHHKAVAELDPSLVAKGLYDLARAFSSFYAAPEGRVVGAPPAVAAARAALVKATQAALGASLGLLGITLLDEM